MAKNKLLGVLALTALIALALIAFIIFQKEHTKNMVFEDVREHDTEEELKSLTQDGSTLEILNKDSQIFTDRARFNNIIIAENDHVGIERIFPNKENPEFAIVWSDCGGSSCGNSSATLVDMKSKGGFAASLSMLSSSDIMIESPGEQVFLIYGLSTYLKNSYGDSLKLTAIYNRNKKKLSFLPEALEGIFDYDQFTGKHPEYLLADKAARGIFLRVMTPQEFSDFRKNISVSGSIINHNFDMQFSAQGIAPHSGGDSAAFFVIDHFNNKIFATVYRNKRFTVFTDFPVGFEDFNTVSIINDYLFQYGAHWDTSINEIRPR